MQNEMILMNSISSKFYGRWLSSMDESVSHHNNQEDSYISSECDTDSFLDDNHPKYVHVGFWHQFDHRGFKYFVLQEPGSCKISGAPAM